MSASWRVPVRPALATRTAARPLRKIIRVVQVALLGAATFGPGVAMIGSGGAVGPGVAAIGSGGAAGSGVVAIGLGALALGATASADAASAPATTKDGRPFFAGVWLVETPRAEAKTIAGTTPPLRPEAAQLYAQRKQMKASGKVAGDPAVDECLPHGVPRILSATHPILILQKPKQITVLYEANHQSRQFYIDDPLPKEGEEPDPTYNGTSVARWDGNALIVDTFAMNDKTWLDDAGLPHSESLRVTERYALTDAEHLRVDITVADPKTFTAPWRMQVTYKRRPDLRIQENACAEKLWRPPGAGGAG
jgi:hypothetical protein